MATLEQQTKELTKQLLKEQKALKTLQSSVNGEVTKLRGDIVYLSEKKESLELAITNLEANILELKNNESSLCDKKKNLEEDLKIIRNTFNIANSELEEVLRKRDEEISQNSQKLQQAHKLEKDLLLTETSTLQTEIESLKKDLSTLKQNAEDYTKESQSLLLMRNIELDQVNDHIKESEKALSFLKEEIIKQTEQKDSIIKDNQKLAHANEFLAAQNKRITDEHEKFIEYERRARKELEAKDLSLQEKTFSIKEDERNLQAKRTYLPQM